MAIGGDDLTADELAYLESGGTSGGPSSEPSQESPAPVQTEVRAPAQSSQPQSSPDADLDDEPEDEDDEIVVGPDGKLRAKNGKFVSHKALHKEREKRKATQRELEETRIRMARGEERLAILNEAFTQNGDPRGPQANQQANQQPNPLDEAPIDPETDFFGWAKQMQRQKDHLARQLNESTQSTNQRETMRAVTEAYQNDARRFMAQEPSFQDAYVYIVQGRHRELAFMGMKDEAQRNAYIAQEEAQIVTQALKAGQSPAHMMFQLAQARGFTPNRGSAPAPAAAPNGARAPVQAPAPQRAAAQQKIEQLRNGQNAAQSLSNAAGGASEGLTMNALTSMSDDEFSAVVDKMSKHQLERLLGR